MKAPSELTSTGAQPKAVFAIPGDPTTPTGGYIYDAEILSRAPKAGLDLQLLTLPDAFPKPDDAALQATCAVLDAVPKDQPMLIDGLAFGAFPEDLAARYPGRIIALCHHPLGMEPDLSSGQAAALLASERAALAHAAAVVVTSRTTAATLTEKMGVPAMKITVAPPGTDRAPRAPLVGDPPQIISVGSVIPRKGHDLLVAALARLTDLKWRCRIVGPVDRDSAHTARIADRIRQADLSSRITMTGALPAQDVAELLRTADIFCLPSRYEGYGMAVAEALAQGLPVIASRTGAIPEVAPPPAAILTPADDVEALTEALRDLLRSPDRRREIGGLGHAHAQNFPGWDETAQIVADVVREVAG